MYLLGSRFALEIGSSLGVKSHQERTFREIRAHPALFFLFLLRKTLEKTAQLGGNSEKSFLLVRLCNLSWNQIVRSLMNMYMKLRALGFKQENNKIILIEPEAKESLYHVN